MKKGLLLLLFSFCYISNINATTCTGTVTFNSQSDVNNFLLLGPGPCDTILGNLIIINSTDIVDLSPLAGVKAVIGNLMIQNNTGLSSLSGLDAIEEVGQLMIVNNPILSDINAFSGIQLSAFGSITINTNPLLSQCCVLESAIGALFSSALFLNDAKNETGCNTILEIESDTSCDPNAIPTIGEWAIIQLSLLMLIFGVIGIQEKSEISLIKYTS